MKNMIQIKILLLFLFISVFYPAAADNTAAEIQELTLDEFIKKGCRNNPQFKKIVIDRLYLEYKDDLNLDIGEIITDFETGYQYSSDTDKDGITGNISVGRLFPATATQVTAGYQNTPGVQDRNSELSFRISQEIADNSFGKKYRLEKEAVGFEKDLILYQVAEAYEDYLYYLVTLYYNWLTSWRELEAAENSLSESRKLVDNIIARNKNSIADQSDVDRSELQFLSKMEAVSIAENTFAKTASKIFDASGIDPGPGFYPAGPENGLISGETDLIFSEDLNKKSRTYRILDLYEKIGQKKVNIGKNSLLPKISLFSEVSLEGSGYELAEDRDRVLSFGISMSGIGENKYRKAVLKSAEIDLDKKKLENIISKKELDTALADYLNDIKNRKALVKIYERKTELAEKILKNERKKFSIGKTNLSSLIDAVNSLDDSRTKKLLFEADINILTAGWLNLTDSLIIKSENSESGYSFSE